MAREAVCQEPVRVDPHGAAPVVPRVERGVVGGQRGQGPAAPLAAEGGRPHEAQEAFDAALPLWGGPLADGGVKERRQARNVHGRDPPARGGVDGAVDAPSLVPQLILDRVGQLLRPGAVPRGVGLPAQAERYLGHVLVAAQHERVEEAVVDNKGQAIAPHLAFVIAALACLQEDIYGTVVEGLGGPIAGVHALGDVGAVVRRQARERAVGYAFVEGLVPERTVVHPVLPRMAHVDQTTPCGVPLAVEVRQKGIELWPHFLKKIGMSSIGNPKH
mmetsp:Transcript_112048/g.349204  ORF Transcript_112048/g.349204 Transcript_112048/m.349204 type:complete len:274 (-) Transcript_112048:208-1029(-)